MTDCPRHGQGTFTTAISGRLRCSRCGEAVTAPPRATDLSIPRVRFYRRGDILIGLHEAEAVLRKLVLEHAEPVVVAAAEKAVRDWEYWLDEYESRD